MARCSSNCLVFRWNSTPKAFSHQIASASACLASDNNSCRRVALSKSRPSKISENSRWLKQADSPFFATPKPGVRRDE
eukprot:CAMPEP_0198499472 /NCGR_PEP_ID=MMETSP1462-20131121/7634_1 /TAXON_ID=1333877 /ORGANISM="Brandtodinium nutriculum, Strain RCC3387" /LENGTH=77 /DNA_ID=CAMNT_0044228451 /DNA_START=109 /DNA_END=339 /DNA_ORIENTATION=-